MMRLRPFLVLAIVGMLMLGALHAATAAPAGPADPPVPRLVKFAGLLPGAARPGAVAVRFALYAEQGSEVPLWAETQRVAVDEAGRFAAYLGASQPGGLPVEWFATGEARWLGVQAEGQAEQPRVLLVSVPYALKAADAETIGGKPLSAFVLAGTTTGTGADGLTYVDTRVLKNGLSGAGPLPQGAGTPGYLGVFTGPTELGNSAIFQSGTSLGLGTTAPAAAFHAVATAAPGALFDVYSNALGALPVVFRAARGTPASPTAVQTDDILGGLAVRGYGATAFTAGRGQVMFKAAENWTDSANGTYLQFTTTPVGGAVWAERMRIDPSGNVGIGTAAPAQKLSVAGTIESTAGGFRFPDGTMQATAAAGLAANTFTGTQTIVDGDLALPPTDGAKYGVLTIGGESFLHAMGGTTNTFVGGQAGGGFATTGANNAAVGYQSLSANTTGPSNAAFGAGSLSVNTTGGLNAAFGYGSMGTNSTGWSNAAFGYHSLFSNTTGGSNAAFGYESLFDNQTGYSNAAFGLYAMNANLTGYENAAFGAFSLISNTTGAGNVGIGQSAGFENTTGSNNTFVGSGAGPDVAHGALSYATAVGAGAVVTQSNALVLGGANGTAGAVNVGIGTTAPAQKLSVAGTIESTTGGFRFPDATTQTTAGLSGYEIVRVGPVLSSAGGGLYQVVTCPTGKSVVGGGGYSSTTLAVLVGSWPSGNNAWAVAIRNDTGSAITGNFYAICVIAP